MEIFSESADTHFKRKDSHVADSVSESVDWGIEVGDAHVSDIDGDSDRSCISVPRSDSFSVVDTISDEVDTNSMLKRQKFFAKKCSARLRTARLALRTKA